MRSQISFALLVVAAAGFGFLGMSWMSAGAPVMAVSVKPAQLVASLPIFEQSVEKGQREAWNKSKTSQGDGDRERDGLRLELLQSANAYSLSPCSKITKTNLVKALTAYATAMSDKMGCKYFWCGGGPRVGVGAEMFSTPLDKRAREAASDAFAQGGVTLREFPAALRLTLIMVVGEQGDDPVPACATTERKS